MPSALVTAVCWLGVLLPSLPFVVMYLAYRRVLDGKRTTVLKVMSGQRVLELYVKAFRAGSQGTGVESNTRNSPEGTVQAFFDEFYHWSSYLYGLFLSLAVVTLVSAAMLNNANLPLGLSDSLSSFVRQMPPMAKFGFAGAYIWSLYDLVRRFRASDLTPAALHFSWLRMIAGCIVGPLASKAATEGLKPIVAFGFGLLPLQTIFEFFKEYVMKKAGVSSAQVPSAAPNLHNLQGMTEGMISRLEEEGIDSAQSLAYADPFRLFLKTDIEWLVIIDFIDQSLLFNYIDGQVSLLRPLGIRGSIELATIYEGSIHAGKEATDAAAAISAVRNRLGQTAEETQNLVRTVWEDDRVGLVWELLSE